jgi:hypothetical protein
MYYNKDLRNFEFGTKDFQIAIENIIHLMSNKERLNYAESEFIYSLFRSNKDENSYYTLFSAFKVYLTIPNFMYKYLVFIGDFEKPRPIRNAQGEFFSNSEIMDDILMFQNEYIEWKPKIEKFNHKNDYLMNLIASEFNKELKELKKIETKELLIKKEKAIILHSKHIYHKVDAMFQELKKKEISSIWAQNVEVIIDYKSIVHIFRGHFAGKAKQFNTYKDFFTDRNIDHEYLHFFLKFLLDEIGKFKLIDFNDLNSFSIPIEFNKKIYEFWLKKIVNSPKSYHLETFYPVQQTKRLNQILKFKKNFCTNNFAYFC